MSDELVSAILPEGGLRAILATTTTLSRQARAQHHVAPAASDFFARSLTSGLLLASLQKEATRVNLQLVCDGPLRGVFVDASSEGTVRGYPNVPKANVEGAPGPFRWRPLLGNVGQLAVLRDAGKGEFYRSSIQLAAFEPAADLQQFFAVSEQVPTEVWLDVIPSGEERLGRVAGLLLQPLPDADPDFFQTWTSRLRGPGGFADVLAAPGEERGAHALLAALFEGTAISPMLHQPLSLACRCNREGVVNASRLMGKAELEDILNTDGKLEATCHFCNTSYVVEAAELRALIDEQG